MAVLITREIYLHFSEIYYPLINKFFLYFLLFPVLFLELFPTLLKDFLFVTHSKQNI